MSALASITECEELTFNSWPALASCHIDGWLARFAKGITGRSNSLNALYPSACSLDEIIALAQPLYVSRQLPLTVRLTPLCPEGCEASLIAKGWRIEKRSHTMIAEISNLALDPNVTVAPSSSTAWREAYHQANPRFDVAGMAIIAQIHAAIVPQAGYATLIEEDRIQALGMAVVERGTVSIHEIATFGAARGRGLGRRLVGSLLAWGAMHGAKRGLLQVQGDNEIALRLYRSLGFVRLYDYAYAIAP